MSDTPQLPICGIIMPISTVDDEHTAEHWERVKQVFCQAIEVAGMIPKPVWEGGRHDVIQARILQNIFENEIVLCDISTKNPNVMLEWGMRLTTKRPTIAVAELGTVLPFDTNAISTLFYDPSLEWNSTQKFIKDIAVGLKDLLKSAEGGEYKSYLDTFKFERVDPKTVTVAADEMVLERIEAIDTRMSRLSRNLERLVDSLLPRETASSEQARMAHSEIALGSRLTDASINLWHQMHPSVSTMTAEEMAKASIANTTITTLQAAANPTKPITSSPRKHLAFPKGRKSPD